MRILIVDDEAPARRRLRAMLELVPGGDAFEVVGEAESGPAALAAAASAPPDLVFLDVQMPGIDGFAVARALTADEILLEAGGGVPPAIVFATAFDEHAVRAFDVHAVDYLVKPFAMPRLQLALERAQARRAAQRWTGTASATTPAGLTALLDAWQRGELGVRRFTPRFAVRVGEKLYYVRSEDIDWVEADGNYLRLHTGIGGAAPRAHLIRKPMAAMVEELDPARFARIHRSTIVNVDRIHDLRHIADGEYQLRLVDGTKLKVSRTYRQNLPAF